MMLSANVIVIVQVSSGALDMARTNLEQMLKMCALYLSTSVMMLSANVIVIVQVSSGALDMARTNLEQMLKMCALYYLPQ